MESNDVRREPRDEYARGSFTWRRMTPGQITGLVIAAAVVLVGLIFWD